jgi:hypothetical protein
VLLAWAACWAAFAALRSRGASPAVAVAAATLLGVAVAVAAATPWRRIIVAGRLSALVRRLRRRRGPARLGLARAVRGLAILYPVGAWRDAPLFPTPQGALRGLAAQSRCLPTGRFLDAGCGLGDALIELHREYPRATLVGVEKSAPLRLACALRCRFATVRRADMWSATGRATTSSTSSSAGKHGAGDRQGEPGAAARRLAGQPRVRGRLARPTWVFVCADGRPLWLYRMTGR